LSGLAAGRLPQPPILSTIRTPPMAVVELVYPYW
jgi:hypothetical protein